MPGPGTDKSGYYLWFDSEFTSLELDSARLLQVALVVTDAALQRVAGPEQDLVLAVRLPEGAPVSSWSEENLPELLRASREPAALELDEVDRRLAQRIDDMLGPVPEEEKRRPILAGNSIHADWFLARKFLPRFCRRLHYRRLDVSTLKLQWLGWYGGEEFDKEQPARLREYFPGAGVALDGRPHDAYYDVIASIAELAFYRSHLRRFEGGASFFPGSGGAT